MKAFFALMLALVLTGCGLAGSAARVGTERISDTQLSAQVTDVLTAQGKPATSEDADLIRRVLERMVIITLVDQLAEREGIEVSQGDIERVEGDFIAQSGSRAAFEDAVLQQQVLPPDQIQPYIRLNLQLTKLREMAGNDDEVFVAGVVDFGKQVGVEVSPRFGTWMPDMLFLGPPEDTLSVEP